MATEKSKKRIHTKDVESKLSKKKRPDEEESDNDEHDDIDSAQVDEVLAAQEFPTRKISKKKKKQAETLVEDKEEEGTGEIPSAITYLLGWKSKDSKWKFRKLRQTWLLQNMYDKEKVSKTNFQILLEYLEDLKGGAKETTLKEAQNIVEEFEDKNEDSTTKRKVKRALKILRVLS